MRQELVLAIEFMFIVLIVWIGRGGSNLFTSRSFLDRSAKEENALLSYQYAHSAAEAAITEEEVSKANAQLKIASARLVSECPQVGKLVSSNKP